MTTQNMFPWTNKENSYVDIPHILSYALEFVCLKQTIHMKCKVLFTLKNNKAKFRKSSARL